MSKYLPYNFSQYYFEKLIWTLHFEEAVYFLPLSSHEFLVVILLTELTLGPPSGFEQGTLPWIGKSNTLTARPLLHLYTVGNLTMTLFEIQVLIMSAIKCQAKFRIFQFAWAMHQQKNCRRFSRNLCISCQLRHTSPFWQGLSFGFLSFDTTILPILYFLLATHLNRRNRGQYFSHWSPCFGFFVCPCLCYNKTHYPMLEKPRTQNITACEERKKKCCFWNI